MEICSRFTGMERKDGAFLLHTDNADIKVCFVTDEIVRVRASFDHELAEESYVLMTTACLHPAVSHHAVVGILDEGVAGQGAVQLGAVGSQQLEVDGVFVHHQRHLAGGKGEGVVILGDLCGKGFHTGALALEKDRPAG